MESIEMFNKVDEIKNTLKRIERTIAEKPKTTNETRIGALNRISEAIKYINELELSIEKELETVDSIELDKIKGILLGTGR